MLLVIMMKTRNWKKLPQIKEWTKRDEDLLMLLLQITNYTNLYLDIIFWRDKK